MTVQTDLQLTLTCDKHELTGTGGAVRVSWAWSPTAFPGSRRSSDWIGMFAEGVDVSVFTAPIKFAYLVRYSKGCWRHQGRLDECGGELPADNGTLAFQVQNMRTNVFFVYVSGDIQYPSVVGTSRVVRLTQPQVPQGVHLALGPTPDSMRVYWQTGGEIRTPGVRYGPCGAAERSFAAGHAAPGRRYNKSDFCDRESQPAGRSGFLPPARLLEATVDGLRPEARYCYAYGDDATGWSEERQFTAPPALGPRRRTVVAAFGDMGQVEPDDTWHHSWDFGNRGELPSANTTRAIYNDTEAEIVLHIGDISYAVGYLSEWENFFRQIEPVAGGRAWMTSIGNHEQVFSSSFVPGTDSGGECGVPYNAHFPFASQEPNSDRPWASRRPWYNFTYGPVAFVQMSTEHSFDEGSEQLAWIERTLAGVDRRVTPWVIFSGHRPMYVASDWSGDLDFGKQLQGLVEPLLLKHRVDLAIWGHFHAYNRFCPMRAGRCDGAAGVPHLVIGTAGYDHSHCARDAPSGCRVCDDTRWGYLRMTFEAASLTTEYVDSSDGTAYDRYVISKPAGAEQRELLV